MERVWFGFMDIGKQRKLSKYLKRYVIENNKLPKNEYGTFDIKSGDLPDEVCYMDYKYLPSICKRNKVE